MKRKKNILVFPCGSEIGLDIHDCLRYSTFFNLIGLSSVEDHGRFVYEEYIGGAPFATDTSIIAYLNEIVKEYCIDAIYPTMDLVSSILTRHESEIGCKVIASNIKTSQICLSKERTYETLQGKIPVPLIYNPNNIKNYPIFIKPKIGYGSRGTAIVHSEKELELYKNNRDLLFLEYLPGKEYTVDCFTDNNGKLLFCKARERQRIRNGISVHTSYIDDDLDIKEYANIINSIIEFSGAWFFQLKRDSQGGLKLLEVADRFGGSSIIAKSIGVNLPLLTLFNAFGYEISINPNSYHTELDRALSNNYKLNINFDTIYVDFDDCLIIDGKFVNHELIGFIYDCRNKGKRIILLTKHEKDLNESLKKFRITNIFDEVIHIKKDDDKTKYIKSSSSIFIDDSFSERNRVLKNCNIPVFGPEMINVLY